ncbi:site-specific DNA-methyltransferase (adenine-specific) [Pontibacter chinhatensis]|uniref:Site-specific DNA-methyltransferase (Adenine-specific) n=1 Tax=Pontibacter chinhatensis TaxID=1436961 RepID=A0A1I2RS24_9BACT|nr:site-specific DNA-methyltransferase (adenine-specific) [Pontibacter chinhatensis]
MPKPYYTSQDEKFTLFSGDCVELLPKLNVKADLVFADLPYFLGSYGFMMG